MLKREDEMAKKLNYSNIRFEKSKKLNLKDEAEARENDRAAKWLKTVEVSRITQTEQSSVRQSQRQGSARAKPRPLA
jgi:hypothetical protein